MIWALVGTFLISLVAFGVFFRYISFFKIKRVYKLLILSGLILMGSAPLRSQCNLHFIFVFETILFALTLFRDLIWGLAYKAEKILKLKISSPFFIKTLKKANYVTLALATFCTLNALYEGQKVPDLKLVEIPSEKITKTQTIVLLSDIHISRAVSSDKIKKIVEKTNEQQPDFIVLAGDIIDDDVEKIASKIELLRDLHAKCGVYFVAGNHEFYVGYEKSVAALKRLNFTFLANDGVQINDEIFLAGVPDFFSSKYHALKIDLDKAFAKSHREYRILVSHTPIDFKEKNNFDLELAGHTHGGQIFPGHILAALYNNFYLAGLYEMQNASLYISRGAGQWGPQMRFLAPSEITIIKIRAWGREALQP